MGNLGKTLGKLALRTLLVTAAPLAIGAILWGVFYVIERVTNKLGAWLERAWQLCINYWPTLLVVVILIVIALTIADCIYTNQTVKKNVSSSNKPVKNKTNRSNGE